MPISFDSISPGSKWTRNALAELWSYKSFHAIARGVVTPKGRNVIVLFVTEDKQEGLTQYVDHLEGNTLHWEGEENHQNDGRIANSPQTRDEIHVFHRPRHHESFTYLGRVIVKEVRMRSDKPSEFVFQLTE
jgi:hypothetical protein